MRWIEWETGALMPIRGAILCIVCMKPADGFLRYYAENLSNRTAYCREHAREFEAEFLSAYPEQALDRDADIV